MHHNYFFSPNISPYAILQPILSLNNFWYLPVVLECALEVCLGVQGGKIKDSNFKVLNRIVPSLSFFEMANIEKLTSQVLKL